MKKLLTDALMKIVLGFILLSLLLFLPAGGFDYRNAWLFLSILFIPMLIAGSIMLVKSPSLLKKRLNGKESDSTQKLVVKLSGLMFLCGFIVAGLDYRFSLAGIPFWASCVYAAFFLCGYIIYFEVMRENAFLSRTIETHEGQTVIDTGLYGIVRHPMYMATIIMFLSIPMILGSLLSLLIFLFYPFLIVIRILNEEKLLEKELKGYTEYKTRVRYRLIPYIW